ncbi:MAG TPA: hypothetical protein VHX15_21240 [Frankiaceae bacterium]|nr:hypothetical protein [Frankiaceae bacterium]
MAGQDDAGLELGADGAAERVRAGLGLGPGAVWGLALPHAPMVASAAAPAIATPRPP